MAPLDTLHQLQDTNTAEVRERLGLDSGFRVLLQQGCAWHPWIPCIGCKTSMRRRCVRSLGLGSGFRVLLQRGCAWHPQTPCLGCKSSTASEGGGSFLKVLVQVASFRLQDIDIVRTTRQ